MPSAVIVVKIIVVIKIPICPACFQAFHDEYIQNGWASKFNISPYCGNFKEVAICAPIVNPGRANWATLLNNFSFLVASFIKFLHFLFFSLTVQSRGQGGRQSLWRKGAEGNERGAPAPEQSSVRGKNATCSHIVLKNLISRASA